jgi:molybdate transport system ATP-binding protein
LRIPIVLVTHDLSEARQLADSLVVMDTGSVLQQGAPAYIYRSPRNARVADLVGVQNRFHGLWLGPKDDADLQQGMGRLQWLDALGLPSSVELRVADKGRLSPGQKVSWVIQGDGLHIGQETEVPPSVARQGCVALQATVGLVRHLGDITIAHINVTALPGVTLRLMRSGPQRQQLAVGQQLPLKLECDWVHVMPTRQTNEKAAGN